MAVVYECKVVGVAWHNPDGTDRQALLEAMRRNLRPHKGTRLALLRDAMNEHDPNAVAVAHGDYGVIGYIPKADAVWLAPVLDAGVDVAAAIIAFAGGSGARWRIGIRIRLEYERP